MDKFWKAALGVGGLGTVGAFVFWSLYKEWLTLGIFSTMTAEHTFFIMIIFLVLVFLSLIVLVIAYVVHPKQDAHQPNQGVENQTNIARDQNNAGGDITHVEGDLVQGDKVSGVPLDHHEKTVKELGKSETRIESLEKEEDSPSPENRVKAALDELVDRVKTKKFSGITVCPGMLGIAVLPCTPPDDPLPLSQKECEIILKLQPLYNAGWRHAGWKHRRHGKSFVTFSMWNDRVDAVSEITEDGVICAAGHEVISVSREFLTNNNVPDETLIIPSVAFEKNIIAAVHAYIGLLTGFEVAGPWIVAMSLFNLKTSNLHAGLRLSVQGKEFTGEAITPPAILVPEDTNIDNPQGVAKVLRPAFDFIWREHNFPQSLNYGAGGDWTGR